MSDVTRFVAYWANDHSAMLAGLAVLATFFWFVQQRLRTYWGAAPAVVAALIITGAVIYFGSLILDTPQHEFASTPEPIYPVKATAPPPISPEIHNDASPKPEIPQETSCPQDEAAQEAPIRALFKAWETLDVNLYATQWTSDAVQYYGHGKFRAFDGIVADRRRMFARLDRVVVSSMNLSYVGIEGASTKYQNDYALYYYFKDGRMMPDLNLQETYLVVCDVDSGHWKIKLNDDQKR